MSSSIMRPRACSTFTNKIQPLEKPITDVHSGSRLIVHHSFQQTNFSRCIRALPPTSQRRPQSAAPCLQTLPEISQHLPEGQTANSRTRTQSRRNHWIHHSTSLVAPNSCVIQLPASILCKGSTDSALMAHTLCSAAQLTQCRRRVEYTVTLAFLNVRAIWRSST